MRTTSSPTHEGQTVEQHTSELIGTWKRCGATDAPETIRVAVRAILEEIKANTGGRFSRQTVRKLLYTN